jgi:hypothetical protein
MTTFVLYFLLGSIIGVGVNYILMRDTDNDD